MSSPDLPDRTAAGAPEEGRRPPAFDGRGGLRPWLVSLVPLGAAAALATLARLSPGVVESAFSRGLYPPAARALRWASGLWDSLTGASVRPGPSPSLSEALIVAGALGLCLAARAAWRAGGVGAAARLGLSCGGGLALAFMALWGLNYSRLPLASTLGLEVGGASARELGQVADALEAQLLVDLAAPGPPLSGPAAVEAARAAWQEALGREPVLGSGACVVARPALSRGLVLLGISGIFSPFTQEAHVAGHLPEPDLLFTACHELAHAQGWAREDEANYLAWRVGRGASSPAVRRSARLLAYLHVLGALRQADPSGLRVRMESLPPALVEAMAARARFWDRERSPAASRAASAVNDAYLRSQGQAGVASYGRMVDLLVAEWRRAGAAFGVADPR